MAVRIDFSFPIIGDNSDDSLQDVFGITLYIIMLIYLINKQNKILSIMKEHFSRDTALFRELNLYKAIYETENIDKRLAEKVVTEAKAKYSSLNKKKIIQNILQNNM